MKSPKNLGIPFFAAATAMVMIAGCAKDKTQDEWNREKASENYAKAQAVAGVYSGSMTDSATKTVSPLAIEVKAGPQSTTGTSVTAVEGRVTILSDELPGAAFSSGSFNVDTNEISAEIDIIDQSGKKNVLDLQGKIDGGSFTGTLENRAYADTASDFNLNKGNSTDQKNTLNRISRGNNNRLQVKSQTFVGTVKGPKDPDDATIVDYPAELIVRGTSATDELLLLDVFSPVDVVGVTLNVRNNPHYFSNANLDNRRGRIFGQHDDKVGAVQSGSIIDCVKSGTGWDCQYIINSTAVLYSGHLEPKQ